MHKKSLLLIVSVIVVVLTITSCGAFVTRGSGDVITETRQVSNFNRIELSGVGEVVITQDGSESLSIETDSNIMKYIEAVVEDGTLKLGFKDRVNFISPTRLVFYVSVDDLTGVVVSGSGDIESDLLKTDKFDVVVSGSGDVQVADITTGEVNTNISGSGEVYLSGDATTQDLTISGSGKYLSGDMCSESVSVNISGSGAATVCATETLVSDISGSGSVNYYGHPSINSSGSGSGTLNNLGEK
jgi:Putative auto-transporter adhesin, head GIN domain